MAFARCSAKVHRLRSAVVIAAVSILRSSPRYKKLKGPEIFALWMTWVSSGESLRIW